MPPKRVNKFNELWLKIPKYKPWLQRHNTSVLHGFCKVCKADIHLGSIGLGALNSHMKGKKHESLMSEDDLSIGMFFKRSAMVSQAQVRYLVN